MKKKYGLGLIFALVLMLVACSSESDESSVSEGSNDNTNQVETVDAGAESTFDTGEFDKEKFNEVFHECMTKFMLAYENSPGAYDNSWEDYDGLIEAADNYDEALSYFNDYFPEYDDNGNFEETIPAFLDLVHEIIDYRNSVIVLQQKVDADQDYTKEFEQIYESTNNIGEMTKEVLFIHAYEDEIE